MGAAMDFVREVARQRRRRLRSMAAGAGEDQNEMEGVGGGGLRRMGPGAEPPRCVEMPSQAVEGSIARRRRNLTVLASRSISPLRRRPFDRRGAREGGRHHVSTIDSRGYITSPTPPSRLGLRS
jgi:hypothetical protein